jgi:hypothetical protein
MQFYCWNYRTSLFECVIRERSVKLSYIIIWVCDQRAISAIIVHHYLSEWSESDHWNYRTSLFEWVIRERSVKLSYIIIWVSDQRAIIEIIVHHYLSEWSVKLSYIIIWVSDQRAISERYYYRTSLFEWVIRERSVNDIIQPNCILWREQFNKY